MIAPPAFVAARYAAGPLGRTPTSRERGSLPRAFWPYVPPSGRVRGISLLATELFDTDSKDNKVIVDRPTLLQVIDAPSPQTVPAPMLAALIVSPWPDLEAPLNVGDFAPWPNGRPLTREWPVLRGAAFLPSAGEWCVRVYVEPEPPEFLVRDVYLRAMLWDATAPRATKNRAPDRNGFNVVGQGNFTLLGGPRRILTLAQVRDLTALEIVNLSGGTVRVGWPAQAGGFLAGGVPLAPFGSPNDRVRWQADAIPWRELWGRSVGAAPIKVMQFS